MAAGAREIKMGETITVKWANSCLYFLCRANLKIKLSSQRCRKPSLCTLMRSKWQERRKEMFSLLVLLSLRCLSLEVNVREISRECPGLLRYDSRWRQKGKKRDPVGFPTQAWVTPNWVERLFCVVCSGGKAVHVGKQFTLCKERKKKKGEKTLRLPGTAGRLSHKPTCCDGTERARILMCFTVEHQ